MKLKIDLNKPDEVRTGYAILTNLLGKVVVVDEGIITPKPEKVKVKAVLPSEKTTAPTLPNKVEAGSAASDFEEKKLEKEEPNEKPTVTLEALRAKTQEKIEKGFRDPIKAELKKVNTNAVSNMKPEHWEDFNKFLDSLN